MRIFYVILTCQKYLPTRCAWIRETWLRQIEPGDDYCFLSSVPDPANKIVGWNSPDTYEGCAQKYLDFVRNATIQADWIVFVDDDTFVFAQRLRRSLRLYDPTQKLYIGKLLNADVLPTMSGGAGFAVSSSLFSEIQEHVRTQDIVLTSIYSDETMAEWVRAVSAQYIYDTRFNSHPHTQEGNVRTAITFHYVTKTLFRQYFLISSTNLSIFPLF